MNRSIPLLAFCLFALAPSAHAMGRAPLPFREDPSLRTFRYSESAEGKSKCMDSNGKSGRNSGYFGECGELTWLDFNRSSVKFLGRHEHVRREDSAYDGLDVTGSNLSGIRLAGSTFRGARLSQTDLGRSDFTGADFTGSDLHEANLSGSRLSRSWFAGADLEDATLEGVELVEADFRSAKMHDARLGSADLSGAVLSGADLTLASLKGAHLQKSNLRGADFSHADVSDADFRGADLRGTDFRVAVGTNVKLQGAVFNDETHLPIEAKEAVAKYGMVLDQNSVPTLDAPKPRPNAEERALLNPAKRNHDRDPMTPIDRREPGHH